MNILGLSGGFHDAAATVIDRNGNILFAAHSERYSKRKNDSELDTGMLRECLNHNIDHVVWYERPWLHNLQQWISRQKQYEPWSTKSTVRKRMASMYPANFKSVSCVPHHLSHAAAGFQTSPFDQAAVVVIDAIGEIDTVSIYKAWYDDQGQAQYKRLWRQGYPHSIGLFYSAITQAVGLKPMDEEYITMGMAAYGSNLGAAWLREQFVHVEYNDFRFLRNFHIGVDRDELQFDNDQDLAASAQQLTEQLIMAVIRRAKLMVESDNLVYMGGVALNCVANRQLGQLFKNLWIMPSPGDAGSSMGAAALVHGGRIKWTNAFLGHEIAGPYPVQSVIENLLTNKIVGVASGRAEFGPRALGNRSLLADPRGPDIKDKVNAIKRRQKFRPFAPVILEELADQYFVMPRGWHHNRYMQSVADCRYPDLFPAVIHHDGSSRVQTVPRDSTGIRQLLEAWYDQTGCPMLLNTSLNIRGEPMVNDRSDADRFEMMYGVKVCS